MKHVIIGAGPAGIVAAEILKKTEPSHQVTVIGDENIQPYSRMAIPYYLTGNIATEGTFLRKGDSYYENADIVLLQDKVQGVDLKNKTLSLEQNPPISFDKLLIATGSNPITPPIEGIDLPGVHPCWTLEDGQKIIERSQPGADVVLIGAGFIGCIILEALALRKVNLTVIESEDHMVSRMLDPTSGKLIKQWCEQKGVNIQTSTLARSIEQSGDKLIVKLDNGKELKANLVISATGVHSNIQFLEGSGIETHFGVMVNDHLQSSHTDVYAAGDVCQGRDFSTGEYNVQAIQPTAVEHGRIAALNMAGRNVVHQGSVNMNVLDTMGLISSSYGLWMGVEGGDSVKLCDEDRYRYINLQFQNDVLIGAQSLGLTQHVGVLRGLIQSKLKLDKWKKHLMENPLNLMEAYLGVTQSIGHNAGII